jgi:hypothetical protein
MMGKEAQRYLVIDAYDPSIASIDAFIFLVAVNSDASRVGRSDTSIEKCDLKTVVEFRHAARMALSNFRDSLLSGRFLTSSRLAKSLNNACKSADALAICGSTSQGAHLFYAHIGAHDIRPSVVSQKYAG